VSGEPVFHHEETGHCANKKTAKVLAGRSKIARESDMPGTLAASVGKKNWGTGERKHDFQENH